MLLRMAKAIAVVAVLVEVGLSSFAAPPEPVSQPTEINGGTVNLGSQWRYHLGDDAAWAAPDFDDSSWVSVPWGMKRDPGNPSTFGFAWYRIRIKPGPGAPQELAVLFPAIEDAYEVYWNGHYVGSYGTLPPRPSWYHNRWPATFGLGRTGDGVLAVRAWNSPSWYFGAFGGFPSSPPVLGSPEAVAQAKAATDFRWLQSNQYVFGGMSLMALIFVIGVIGWVRERKQWVLLWMALFAFLPCAALLLWVLKTLRDPLATGIFQLAQAASDISIIFLLLWLLDLKDEQRLVRTAWFLSIANGLVSILRAICFFGLILPNPGPAVVGWTVFCSFSLAFELFPLYLIALALKRRRRLDHSRWMVVISSSLVLMITTFGGIVTIVGHFFQKDLSGLVWLPIAVVWGNPIRPLWVALPICLLTLVYAVYRYTATNRRRQIALEEEFKSAREIQSVLIPERLPKIPGIAITSAYKPAREVGGDFFQVFPLENGSALIVVGDVSGKGLSAAMAVSLIVGMLRALIRDNPDPAELATALNRSAHGQLHGGFATCIALRVDWDGSCVLVNAGHPAPFLNGRELPTPGALPIGIALDATYEETRFELNPGDYLALYTDGLLEARNEAGELYGFERLHTLFSVKPSAMEAAEAAVGFGQDDDITVLTLERPPGDATKPELTGKTALDVRTDGSRQPSRSLSQL
jgi:hypothetical protein